jgi:hypothetical protein
MDRMRSCVAAAVALLVLTGCSEDDVEPGIPPPVVAPAGSNTVVLEWNRLLTDNQGAGNIYSFRQYAMLHVAMFDAVNGITRRYRPYRIDVINAGPSASPEAAAAQAARDVLAALYPAAVASFDSALATRLATLPQDTVAQGVEVGKQAAQAVLQWRTGDGSANPDPAYTPPLLPGYWRPTAPGQVATGGRYAQIVPFATLSPTQFLPEPPPQLNSTQYADSFQQVYSLGRVDSTTRTAEQTQLARLIAGVNYRPGPFALWNTLARSLAESRQLSLVDTARLFALLNVSMHDGLQTTFTSKYVYQLWRPVTAIQNAMDDANDATIPDATWTPLITTPPYPSHASNVACIGMSASRAMGRALGADQIPFNFTWTWTGAAGAGADATRSYLALSQLSEDAGMARVYGGIHFSFELTAAQAACRKVADYVYDNTMQLR